MVVTTGQAEDTIETIHKHLASGDIDEEPDPRRKALLPDLYIGLAATRCRRESERKRLPHILGELIPAAEAGRRQSGEGK